MSRAARSSSPGSTCERFYQPPLLRVEPGAFAGARIGGRVLGTGGRRDDAGDAWIRNDPFEQRFGPALDPERLEVARGRAGEEAALREGPHDDDAQVELLGEWQDSARHLAFMRVVGDLDRIDQAALHHLLELVEGRRLVVRGTEEAHALLFPLVLEPREVLLPGHEVVHLLEIDPAAEVTELGFELEPALLLGRRPDLRRDEDVVPPP